MDYKDELLKSQARVGILLSALNVALNSNDCYALDGARFTLEQIRDEDLTVYRELKDARERIRQLEADIEALQRLDNES